MHSPRMRLFWRRLSSVGRPDFKPRYGGWAGLRNPLLAGLGFAAGAVALVGVLYTAGTLAFGSPAAALARLRGEALSVQPDYMDLGAGPAGQVLSGTVQVTNWSDQSVRLVGGTSNCGCTTIKDMPVVLEPGESKPLTVSLRLSARSGPGALTYSAEIWSDSSRQRTIHLRLGCKCVAGEQAEK